MKTKIFLLTLLFAVSFSSHAQLVVTDPARDFQDHLKWIEEKIWQENEALDRAEMIVKLREQLEQLQEARRNIEETYRLQRQVQEDLKVLGAVADGGFAGLVNAFEIILGEPLNPADYIPNIPEFSDFRSAMDYNAASYLSSDTRQAHRELFTHDSDDPDRRADLDLTRNARRLNASMVNLFAVSQGWRDYQDELEAQAILQKKAMADKLREMAKKMSEELQTDGLFAMSSAERMQLLLTTSDLMYRASELELEVAREVAAKLEKNKPSPFELVNLTNTGVRIRMAHTLRATVRPYNSNQEFSLVEFERNYAAGQVNRALEASGTEGQLEIRPLSSEQFQRMVVRGAFRNAYR